MSEGRELPGFSGQWAMVSSQGAPYEPGSFQCPVCQAPLARRLIYCRCTAAGCNTVVDVTRNFVYTRVA